MPRTTYRVPIDPARFVVTALGVTTDTRPAHRQRFALVTAVRSDGERVYIVRDYADGKEVPFRTRARAIGALPRMRRTSIGFLGWPLGSSVHYREISVETIPGPNELDARFEIAEDGNGLTVLRDHERGFEIPFFRYEDAAAKLPALRDGSLDVALYMTRPVGLS